jgi:transposase
MRKIREAIRLRHAGLSHRQIGRSLGQARSTIGDYLQRAEGAGLHWPLPEDLDDTALERRLFPDVGHSSETMARPQPDWALAHRELRRAGVTLFLLWQEYRESHPEGYQYSRFCDLFHRFAKKLNPSMRQIHRAGEKIFVDFSGKKPEIIDPHTGEITEVEFFVGALGASGFTYAEAVLSQDLSCWIRAHQNMLAYFHGSSAIYVPDNLKSGITTPCRYEPGVNRTYEEMAAHYGAVVIPARVRRPKDKPKAELSVCLAQRWILASLRNRMFFSLAELNEAIREKLELLNDRPMQKLKVSRRQLYEQIDRPALRPLPSQRYEIGEWSRPKVSIDYHVEVDHNFYSVHFSLLHERLDARATATTVEIFFKARRIASHCRLRGRSQYATLPEHMPAAHRAHLEWSPSRLVQWAEKTGPATAELVAHILQHRPHPEQGYRASMGLMRLGAGLGADRLEAAARRAIHLRAYSYQTVKNILAAGTDRLPLEPDTESNATCLPTHDNIRGAAYYAAKEIPC